MDNITATFTRREKNPHIFTLIENRNWKKIRKILKSTKAFRITEETDASNLSCLGLATGHEAPVDILEALLQVNPPLIDSIDSFGATSLHIGCLNGASLESIQTLLGKSPKLACQLDHDNRAPLHHAVEYAAQSGNMQNPYTEVIQALCMAAPRMVHCLDKADDTPIDLVQVVKVQITDKSKEYYRLDYIYKILQRFSIQIYSEDKAKWETEGYDQDTHSLCGNISTNSKSTNSKSSGTSASWESIPTIDSADYKHFEGFCSEIDETENDRGGKSEEY